MKSIACPWSPTFLTQWRDTEPRAMWESNHPKDKETGRKGGARLTLGMHDSDCETLWSLPPRAAPLRSTRNPLPLLLFQFHHAASTSARPSTPTTTAAGGRRRRRNSHRDDLGPGWMVGKWGKFTSNLPLRCQTCEANVVGKCFTP
jgi:hypothetical protein